MNRKLKLELLQNHSKTSFDNLHGLIEYIHIHPKGEFDREGLKVLYERLFQNPNERTSFTGIMNAMEKNELGLIMQCVTGTISDKPVALIFFKTTEIYGQPLNIVLYIGVADKDFACENGFFNLRGRGISKMLYHAADIIASNHITETILDSEFAGQADNIKEIQYTKKRLQIHGKGGAMAMMIDNGCGRLITPIILPRMNENTKPLMMHLLYRPIIAESDITEIEKKRAIEIISAYPNSFGLSETDRDSLIDSREWVERRLKLANRFLLVPISKLPDMIELAKDDSLLMEQIERDHGSFKEHSEKVKLALKSMRE